MIEASHVIVIPLYDKNASLALLIPMYDKNLLLETSSAWKSEKS